MNNAELENRFSRLSTPLICDACIRLEIRYRVATGGIRPTRPHLKLAGRVRPARHCGSVDINLEAIESAEVGEVLVIDNAGRVDEACIGDLIVLEAKGARLGGLVVWGLHRDSAELDPIELPIFSYGSSPSGPQRLDPRPADALLSAQFESFQVSGSDFVVADDDGVVFAPLESAAAIFERAEQIAETERKQADLIRAGRSLRAQLEFGRYLEIRASDPSYTLRRHLRRIGGAIEE